MLYMANDFFFTVISTNHSSGILVFFIGRLFNALKILSNLWLPNYRINMISSNMLSLVSTFSQYRYHDSLTPKSLHVADNSL